MTDHTTAGELVNQPSPHSRDSAFNACTGARSYVGVPRVEPTSVAERVHVAEAALVTTGRQVRE